MLGAGSFAQSTLLPALKAISGVSFIGVCNATGPRSRNAAEKFGFSYCSNSETDILQDPKINAVLIATRHNLHASQSLAALRAGKSVFCEKPLCLNEDELAELVRRCVTEQSQPAASPASHGRFQSPLRAHGRPDEKVSVPRSTNRWRSTTA